MTTETTTCLRCQTMIGARTQTVQAAEGTIHLHCATREERERQPVAAPARPVARQVWRRYVRPDNTCRFGGYELDWDC